MEIKAVTFPETGVCCITVTEAAEPYAAEIERVYLKRRKHYNVQGYPKDEAPREAIEACYGVDIFRMDALNNIMTRGAAALVAQVCNENDLVSLAEAEPSLIEESDDGFTLELRVPYVPQVDIPKYKGFTVTAPRAEICSALALKIAEGLEIPVPELAVQILAEGRKDNMQRQLTAQGMSLAQLLKKMNKTPEQLEADLRAVAQQELKSTIVLFNIARQQGLTATQEQQQAEYKRMVNVSKGNTYVYENKSAQMNIRNRITLANACAYLAKHNDLHEVEPPKSATAAPAPKKEDAAESNS